MKDLYNRSWERNWGFVRYTDAEFDQLAREFKMILDPELVALAEVDGELAGITVLIPDANQVFKRMRGRLLPFGIFHLLSRQPDHGPGAPPHPRRRPRAPQQGLRARHDPRLYGRTMAKGYRRCEASWTLEDNRRDEPRHRGRRGEALQDVPGLPEGPVARCGCSSPARRVSWAATSRGRSCAPATTCAAACGPRATSAGSPTSRPNRSPSTYEVARRTSPERYAAWMSSSTPPGQRGRAGRETTTRSTPGAPDGSPTSLCGQGSGGSS